MAAREGEDARLLCAARLPVDVLRSGVDPFGMGHVRLHGPVLDGVVVRLPVLHRRRGVAAGARVGASDGHGHRRHHRRPGGLELDGRLVDQLPDGAHPFLPEVPRGGARDFRGLHHREHGGEPVVPGPHEEPNGDSEALGLQQHDREPHRHGHRREHSRPRGPDGDGLLERDHGPHPQRQQHHLVAARRGLGPLVARDRAPRSGDLVL
mmetsp:Transcript_14703/g.41624  ORF Transcript_14703/g.41624 Transcript_14703/m.41624 type:complete len:208 (+) Transcript_14703:520-1143(+)